MKRRIVSAALTSSPAAWVRGLDWGKHTFQTTDQSGIVRAGGDATSSNEDGLASLTRQVEELKQKLSQTHRRLRDLQLDTVTTLVAAVEAKDPPAERHSMHVAFYADRLTRPFRLSMRQNDVIRTAAVLHDIGKIGIPDAILTKPGPLTPDEWRVVKQHPVTGAAILKSAACLQRELPMVLHHHEWYEGGGYPDGLRGEEIPFGARILQVADAIDAMLSPRSYKGSYGVDRVCSELLHGRGVQFDPVVADVAMAWLKHSPDEAISPSRSCALQTMHA
jgi:putative nucleotidyltransferase with HDIG domain